MIPIFLQMGSWRSQVASDPSDLAIDMERYGISLYSCVHICNKFHIWSNHQVHANLCSKGNNITLHLDWFYHKIQLVNCFCRGISSLITVVRGREARTWIRLKATWLCDLVYLMLVVLARPLLLMIKVMVSCFYLWLWLWLCFCLSLWSFLLLVSLLWQT